MAVRILTSLTSRVAIMPQTRRKPSASFQVCCSWFVICEMNTTCVACGSSQILRLLRLQQQGPSPWTTKSVLSFDTRLLNSPCAWGNFSSRISRRSFLVHVFESFAILCPNYGHGGHALCPGHTRLGRHPNSKDKYFLYAHVW